ncbi:hypothetical protein SDJN02_25920 [Cucurbita argyrosperma subsp. argyrosperma]|nr:hypothetical protein SDJN02_25920 [Cucurbita argyrosperma subsp. argyrosperma]
MALSNCFNDEENDAECVRSDLSLISTWDSLFLSSNSPFVTTNSLAKSEDFSESFWVFTVQKSTE